MKSGGHISSAGVLGGLLVGGASRRMGTDKALVEVDGQTMAERVAAALRLHTDSLLLLGSGPVPATLADLPRVADPALGEGAATGTPAGPLAGILAALRHRPGHAWVICPCDLPAIEPPAVAWLLAQERPDDAAVFPRPNPAGPPQPLFALYRPAALPLVEELVSRGIRGPRHLAALPGVRVVPVPLTLAPSWRDADTPDDLP